ncbi:MAG: right-handed parallel beta-helix repeat-containing protein [bacterium]
MQKNRTAPFFLFAAVVLTLVSRFSFGLTVLPPEINGNLTVSGEIKLSGDCRILKGAELKILAGSRIMVGEECFSSKQLKRISGKSVDISVPGKPVIIVDGRLCVTASSELPVTFEQAGDEGSAAGIRWGGIVVSGSAILENVKITDAVYGVLACDSANVFLKNFTVSSCGIGVIAGNNSTVKMVNSDVMNSAVSGVELYDRSSVFIRNSQIYRGRNSGVFARDRSSLEITGCEIRENKTGVYIRDGAKFTLKDNLFTGNGRDVKTPVKYDVSPLPAASADFIWEGLVYIREDFVVPPGKVLCIRPGTKIVVSTASIADEHFYITVERKKTEITRPGKCDIIVSGDIRVEGSKKSPVVFNCGEGFGSVILEGSGKNSDIDYLSFSGAEVGFYAVGGNSTKFRNTSFKNCGTAVVAMENTELSFSDCLFSRNNYGILSYDIAELSVEKCFFENCRTSVGLKDLSSAVFRAPLFEKNENAVQAFDKSSVNIKDGSVRENTNGFIFFDNVLARIENNTFAKNKTALKIEGSPDVTFLKNIFMKNVCAVLKNFDAEVSEDGNRFFRNGSDSEYISVKNPTGAGVISESEVWEGTVELTGDIVVREGAVLYIKDGARIIVKPSVRDFVYSGVSCGEKIEATHPGLVDIIVEGDFEIQKGETVEIRPQDGLWGGMIFVKNSNAVFNNAVIRKAVSAVSAFGCSKAQFEKVNLVNCRSAVSVYDKAFLKFNRSRAVECDKGIGVYGTGICDISLSIITGCGEGIYIFGGGVGAVSNLISKNRTGLKLVSGMLELRKNTFLANERALELAQPIIESENKFFENILDR